MEKIDLTKKYNAYYTAKTKPALVEFGNVYYLTIIGKGEPTGKYCVNGRIQYRN